jgi:hypothetical protein
MKLTIGHLRALLSGYPDDTVIRMLGADSGGYDTCLVEDAECVGLVEDRDGTPVLSATEEWKHEST